MAGSDSKQVGHQGERLAARFLKQHGCKVLRRNCRNKYGEIDLIVRDGDEVVFVEVKARTSIAWGSPLDAITPHKQKRLRLPRPHPRRHPPNPPSRTTKTHSDCDNL